MTKYLSSILLLISIVVAGCSGTSTDDTVPTQIGLPTAEPTLAPTKTAEPTDIPLPTPTELVIPQTVADNPAEQAYVRFVNTSSDIGVVDVYIEALAVATNLQSANFTEREEITSGRYNIRILPTGSFLTEPALYEETLNIFGGDSLIFVISGTFENPMLTRLNEPNDPLEKDTSRLLMVNALQGADNLIMSVDNTPQTASTPYLQTSEITTYPADRVTLTFQNSSTTLLEQLIDLRERENYTMVVVGDITRPDSIQLLLLTSSAPGLAQVSLINTSAFFFVDVYLSGNLFASTIELANNNEPQPILAGVYDVTIYPAGENPEEVDPLIATQFITNPDELTVLVISGEGESFRVSTYRSNLRPTYDNQSRIAFLNSSASTPTVLLQSNNGQINERVSYGRFTSDFTIPSDEPIDFNWIQQLPDSQDVILEDIDNFFPQAGELYLYILTGQEDERAILVPYTVGTLGFDAVDEQELANQPTLPPPVPPSSVRLLNLWEDMQPDVWIDGTLVAEGLEYGQVTNPLTLENGDHTIVFIQTIASEGEDVETATLAEFTGTFESNSDYTFVAASYLFDETRAGTIIRLDDTNATITGATSGLRLAVVEAKADSRFGVGYSEPFAGISQPNAQDDFRTGLPIGIEQVIRNVPVGNASPVELVPTGTYNIRIIDNRATELAFTHIEYTLQPEIIHTVFLWENPNTIETTTMIVPIPSP